MNRKAEVATCFNFCSSAPFSWFLNSSCISERLSPQTPCLWCYFKYFSLSILCREVDLGLTKTSSTLLSPSLLKKNYCKLLMYIVLLHLKYYIFEGRSFPNILNPLSQPGEIFEYFNWELQRNLYPHLKLLWARQFPHTGHINSDLSSHPHSCQILWAHTFLYTHDPQQDFPFPWSLVKGIISGAIWGSPGGQ